MLSAALSKVQSFMTSVSAPCSPNWSFSRKKRVSSGHTTVSTVSDTSESDFESACADTRGTTPGNYSPPGTEEENASILKAPLDARSQQLAHDLQAAVQELAVRPELTLGRDRSIDEHHDNSEISTPSPRKVDRHPCDLSQPPPLPMHRVPSWESRIYKVAAGGLKVPRKEDASSAGEMIVSSTSCGSFHSLGINNVSVPVYATVKGRASQIRSVPFSGDSSDSSDGEEIGSESGVSAPSHPTNSGESETDISSPGKSAVSSVASTPSPTHRSSSSPPKSLRREPSIKSEGSGEYDIPPDAFDSVTNSMEIALSAGFYQNLTLGLTPSTNVNSSPKVSGAVTTSVKGSPRKESLEKSGYLKKLGGKFKIWRKRWFVLKNGSLTYWKSLQHVHGRSAGSEIILDENCQIIKEDGAATFEIGTGAKTYYLTAESVATVDDWVRILQNVVRRKIIKLLLSMEDNEPTLQGWLTKVKNGQGRRCWCVLIGNMFLSFKSPQDTIPSSQINMKDVRIEDVKHESDSDSDEKEDENTATSNDALTIGIFPSHQNPIYLHLPAKQEKDAWLYHLTIASGKGPSAGTQFEQLIHKLMEVDGDPNCSLWKNPLLLHSKENITSPLTSVSSFLLQTEAVNLFMSCQVFMSMPLEPPAFDYHVELAQNTLQLCLDYPELQAELICALVKQTSRSVTFKNSPQVNRKLNKIKHAKFLLNATHSFFVRDSSSNHSKVQKQISSQSQSPSRSPHRFNNHVTADSSLHRSCRGGVGHFSPVKTKAMGPSSSVPSSPLLSHKHSMHHYHALNDSEGKSFIQGWQLLALAVSLFLPRNNKLLWYLRQHLRRNADAESESGKYAAYCQRSIERTMFNGIRHFKPSRLEVLSILMKNPFHHSLPHSVPVHFLNGGYEVVGFDGSTTVEEFLVSLCQQIGCRDPLQSGFALCEDDPFDKEMHHTLKPRDKICDVISQWEACLRLLRVKRCGKFETRRAVTLSFVSRIYRRSGILQETDKEKLLLCYQTNQGVVSGGFPLSKKLSLELAALMAQIDCGDYKPEIGRGSGSSQEQVVLTLEKYYPVRFRENFSQEEFKALCDSLIDKWILLKGKSSLDCVRIYLTCTRKWEFFGATLYSVKVRGTPRMEDGSTVWVAIGEDGIAVLDNQTFQQIEKFSLGSVQTFGGTADDHFMVVVDDLGMKRRITFSGISKHKILEMTNIVADYINACLPSNINGQNNLGTSSGLTRDNSLKSCWFQSFETLPPSTPQLDRRNYNDIASLSTPLSLQRFDSYQNHRTPRT